MLNLNPVELAVLSACETNLGELRSGKEVLGLQRAFQTAARRSTVNSLWEVEDQATPVLMIKFYCNDWEKERSRRDALREAQGWLFNDPEKFLATAVSDPITTTNLNAPVLGVVSIERRWAVTYNAPRHREFPDGQAS
ncbi:CHAT domain protein [Lignipirellula cremea]|uniref:CHAT domain protein n=1 Tax=Lignipirellula cremea TaxID=2528010 RepID=A0A518DRQ2_9BACT|nr:CHAT domain protein [Lignipirellula cremea]